MPNQFYSEFPENQASGTLKSWPAQSNKIETSQSWKSTRSGFRTSTVKLKQTRQDADYIPVKHACSTKKGEPYPAGIGDKPSAWKVSSNKKQPSNEHYGNESYEAAGKVSQASTPSNLSRGNGWGPTPKVAKAKQQGAKSAPGRRGSASAAKSEGGY